MPSIILSSITTYRLANSLIVGLSSTYGNLAGTYGSGTLKIMKGTIPTDFSTLTASTSRSTDVLVTIPLSSTASVVYQNNNIKIDTAGAYSSATQSGTASWFWLYSGAKDSSSLSFAVQSQLIGTITGTGLGGDIELGVVDVVSGSPFKISNFLISMDYFSTF